MLQNFNHTSFFKLPLFLSRHDDEDNIIEAAKRFIKLITVTELGGLKSDPQFGFHLLDYEYCQNINHFIRTDFQQVIGNKMNILSFISHQIEDRLFYYLPESRDFISRIEVQIDDQHNGIEVTMQSVSIVIHFKLSRNIHIKQLEEYKICLNKLRTMS